MTDSFSLIGKRILVTGASSGIGKAIALKISELGGTVVALGRDRKRLEETVSELQKGDHQSVCLDLRNFDELSRLTQEIPKLNGAVFSAGILNYSPFKFISYEKLRETQEINYESPLILTQKLLKNRLIENNSSIVFISSISSIVGTKANALYAGSKAALVGISKALALELSSNAIRVNAVSPGIIQTNMFKQMENTFSPEQIEELKRIHPLGLGNPEDVANGVAFLLSNASRWITGTNLIIDGGYTCQ